jgi:PAS domain S-box-containing protein
VTENTRPRLKRDEPSLQPQIPSSIQKRQQITVPVADYAPVLVWMSGTDGLCTHFSKAWLDFTGRSLHQELGNGWTEGVHPDDLERCMGIYLQAFERRQSFQMEYRLRRHDGEYRWILDIGDVRFSPSGSFEGYAGIVFDETERKAAEEIRSRLAAIVEYSEDAISSLDLDGRITSWNRAAEKIFGYTEAEAIGQPITILMSPEQHEEERRIQHAVRSGERIELQEGTRVTKSGERIYVSLTTSPVKDSTGRIVGISRISRDVTERKHAEEELADLSRKVIHGQEEERKRIARELHDHVVQRVALVGVNLQLLQQESIETDVKSRLSGLSDELGEISQDIHEISHQLHPSKLEYVGLVDAMKSFCREFSDKHRVAVAFTHGEISETIQADISLCLYRILEEALRNGAKHGNANEFEVKLGSSKDEVELTIFDKGTGFNPRDVAKRGTLGLVGMRERVRIVHGTVSISSKPMKGTTVRVKVPLRSNQSAA